MFKENRKVVREVGARARGETVEPTDILSAAVRQVIMRHLLGEMRMGEQSASADLLMQLPIEKVTSHRWWSGYFWGLVSGLAAAIFVVHELAMMMRVFGK